MIKKYKHFIKEDADNFGEWVENYSDDEYVKNIINRFIKDIDPTIRVANSINLLDDNEQADIKSQIEEYLANGIEDKETSVSVRTIIENEPDDMNNLNKFNEFNEINEGKTSQFIFKNMIKIVDYIRVVVDRIEGVYIPLEFKNKRLGYDVNNKIIEVLDYLFFDSLKIYISKRFKNKVNTSETYTGYLKEKKGVDIYEIIEFILDGLQEDKFIISKDPKIKEAQLEKLNHLVVKIKEMKGSVKALDDTQIEEKKFEEELKDLLEQMKKLDPSNIENLKKSKDHILGDFDDASKVIDKMVEKKPLNDILDKYGEYGKTSLTAKDQSDLDKYSKESIEHDYDTTFFMTKLKEKWKSDDIQTMYEEEKKAWADDYKDGSGLAEDVILNKLTGWFENKYKALSDEVFDEVYNKLQEEFKFLKIK